MSNIYQYNFISPNPIYAIIKEEFKSYFDTGSVDDLMFPIYVNKCLRKLGKSSFEIANELLNIENFQARLPSNFNSVREAWMCNTLAGPIIKSPNNIYTLNSSETVSIEPIYGEDVCTSVRSECEPCPQEEEIIINKTSFYSQNFYQRLYILKPGTITAKNNCNIGYSHLYNEFRQENFTPYSSTIDSFDIRDNKFITNFRNGTVHLVYYADSFDEEGSQLIPDNFRIMEYIEKFLKYKVFETLTNQVNDETFNQLQQKMLYAKQEADEAFIMADIEIKKQTIWQKQKSIKDTLNRNNMYNLNNRSIYKNWRR